MKLIYGQGYNTGGKYKATEVVDGKRRDTRVYKLWYRMIRRCYDKSIHLRQKTYRDCYCSDYLKNFQNFADWVNQQIGFENSDYQLEKDLLVAGNKEYSERTCLLLPVEINNLILKCQATRGDCPIGVSLHSGNNTFSARCSNVRTGKKEYLGIFRDKESAFLAYKSRKEHLIKEVANRYKSVIDPRAYLALMEYTVNITD